MRRAVLLVGVCLPLCLSATLPLASRAAGPRHALALFPIASQLASNASLPSVPARVSSRRRWMRTTGGSGSCNPRSTRSTGGCGRSRRTLPPRPPTRCHAAPVALPARPGTAPPGAHGDRTTRPGRAPDRTVRVRSPGPGHRRPELRWLRRAAGASRVRTTDRAERPRDHRGGPARQTRRAGGQCGSRIAREQPATLGRRAGRQAHADRRGPPRRRDEPKRAVPRP